MKLVRNLRHIWFVALLILAATGVTPVAGQNSGTSTPASEPAWSVAAVGDAIMTRQVKCFENDAAFMGLVKPIREADAAVINLELNLFRIWDFQGYPQAENGGNYEVAPPEVAEDLKWMGFNLFNHANNHTTDYGVEGMMETWKLLDSMNLVYAGAGMNAGEAAQAKYFETAKGRFALIGMATSFTPMSRAGESRPDMKGRPGVNALRTTTQTQLAPAQMAELRKIAREAGGRVPDSEKEPVRFGGGTFLAGAENGQISTVNVRDEDRILRSIRSAAKQADFVIVHSHSHDMAGPTDLSPAPPHLREFVKKCMDAGADMFAVSGPHRLRGIEIYKGKPIFYSLGNFFMQNETIEPMPDDMYERYDLGSDALAADFYDARSRPDPKTGLPTSYYPAQADIWESVVAVPAFRGDRVVEIKLYPVDMGFRMPRSQQGTPRLADPALARKIIERVAKMSEQYGTTIVFKDGIGLWTEGGR
ncbi:MAG: CapA family protein [Acidobacteria bacterium]|nr:CapA family protein [Acidobacteriota bacterium]